MSDLFNLPSSRASVLSLLKGRRTEKSPEDNGIFDLPVPELPPTLVDSSLSAARELRSKKIPIRRPNTIPENVTVEAKDYIRPALIDEGFVEATVELPTGNDSFLPFYQPSKVNVPPDNLLYHQMLYQTIQMGVSSESEFAENIKNMFDVASKHSFTTGNFEGQATRLKQAGDIRLGREGKIAPVTLKELNMTLEDMAVLLEKTLPITYAKEPTPLNSTLDYFIRTPEEEGNEDGATYLPTVTKMSLAGLPWPRKQKKDLMNSALALSDVFIRAVSDAIQKRSIDGVMYGSEQLLKDFWYLSCSLMFPKAEVYETAKCNEKVRNIASAPYVSFLLGSMLTQKVVENSNINLFNANTPSLAKFNPFAGNMNRFCEKLLNLKESQAWIYADNLYIAHYRSEDDELDWYSLDLEKAEAGCTPEYAQALAYYFLTRAFVDEKGKPMFNLTWAYILLIFLPSFFVDSSMLVYNLQVKLYGQGSGGPWTFLLNHLKTSISYAQWRYMDKFDPGDPVKKAEWERVTGSNWKIERVIKGLKGELLKLKNYTKGHDPFEAADRVPQLDLDLLGWGVAWEHHTKQYVALLDRERFVKSMVFGKKDPKMFEGKPAELRAYQIQRYSALYLIGGWADQLTRISLLTLIANAKEGLQKYMESDAAVDAMIFDSIEKYNMYHDLIDSSMLLDPKRGLGELMAEKPVPEAPVQNTGFRGGKRAELAPLLLLTLTKKKLGESNKVIAKLKKWIAEAETTGDWADAAESEDWKKQLAKLEREQKTGSSLSEVSAILNALGKELDIPSLKFDQVKNPDLISNPVASFHVPAKNPELGMGSHGGIRFGTPLVMTEGWEKKHPELAEAVENVEAALIESFVAAQKENKNGIGIKQLVELLKSRIDMPEDAEDQVVQALRLIRDMGRAHQVWDKDHKIKLWAPIVTAPKEIVLTKSQKTNIKKRQKMKKR